MQGLAAPGESQLTRCLFARLTDWHLDLSNLRTTIAYTLAYSFCQRLKSHRNEGERMNHVILLPNLYSRSTRNPWAWVHKACTPFTHCIWSIQG